MQKVTEQITFSITATPEEVERIKQHIDTEVKKTLPPYEIVTIKDNKNNLIWFRVADGTFKTLTQMNVSHCAGTPQEYFFSPNNGQYQINRASSPRSGTTFVVGDAVFVRDNKFPSIIKELSLQGDMIFVITSSGYKLPIDSNLLKNSTNGRLRTQNGTIKYDGDDVSIARHNGRKWQFLGRWEVQRYSQLLYDGGNEFFDTTEEARAYIAEHNPKPLFTTEDGVKIWDKNQIVYMLLPKEQWTKVEENAYHATPVKVGDNVRYGAWLRFSTKEAREEYIKLHKPMFSLQELIDVSNQPPYVISIGSLKYMADQKLKA